MNCISSLASSYAQNPDITGKLPISFSCSQLGLSKKSFGFPGDDAAAIPDGNSWKLIAMEGFMNEFVETEPWFAGWCSVMVNLSDIIAMGGRGLAMTNAIWAPDKVYAEKILGGMREASETYNIPIVGGHTNLKTDRPQLAATILGRADVLITSFDAVPGQALVVISDQRGSYVGESKNFASFIGVNPKRLQKDNEILPALAEKKLISSGKDISQGGIIGTSIMLAESSGVGIEIDPLALKCPDNNLEKWMTAFPSFGFLLSVNEENLSEVLSAFQNRSIDARRVGRITEGTTVNLVENDNRHLVWDHSTNPYLGL
tara:strand:+ start:613 stop:1560 length:948 start_codon:yes stop_codon:yes gene_type:complete